MALKCYAGSKEQAVSRHASRLRDALGQSCTLQRSAAAAPPKLAEERDETSDELDPSAASPKQLLSEQEPDTLCDPDASVDSARETRKSRPASARSFDGAKIFISSGSGGSGAVAFFRERFQPRGGPAGGNGGRGGDVVLVGDRGLSSLLHFRRKAHFTARSGGAGGGKNMHGADAEARFVRVPPGTVVRDANSRALLCEVGGHAETRTVAVGGKGGRGNAAFKSHTNKAPVLSENGERGKGLWLELELQVVADVGIIGCPNAGKSTLLSASSRADPKVADYPFTTLVPNLGVAQVGCQQLVLADVPGLIEGASHGRGLGSEFLGHAKRCSTLVHVVDGTAEDVVAQYNSVRSELGAYEPFLMDKPEIVMLNKADAMSEKESASALESLRERGVSEPMLVSAATDSNVSKVIERAWRVCQSAQASAASVRGETLESDGYTACERGERTRKFNLRGKQMGPAISAFSVRQMSPNEWLVKGSGVERLAQMTNWQYFESVLRFQNMLRRAGVEQELVRQGAADGDAVAIGDEVELEFDTSKDASTLHAAWLAERQALGTPSRGTSTWPRAA